MPPPHESAMMLLLFEWRCAPALALTYLIRIELKFRLRFITFHAYHMYNRSI